MKQKAPLIAAVAFFLVAGAAAVLVLRTDREPAEGDAPASASEANSRRATPGTSPTEGLAAQASRSSQRERENPRNADLVARYGEARTNLSKHVAGTTVELLDQAMEMAEMASSGQLANAFGGPRAGLNMALGGLGRELQLSDEQQERASAAFAAYQQRQMTEAKQAVDTLRNSPEPLMALFLASDAFARGEISEDEYQQLQESAGADLSGVINPLDRENFRGGQPLSDPDFLNEFRGVLEPDQVALLEQNLASREPREPSPISDLPAMELEQLDQAMTSGSQLMGGLRQMMEGMGSLQDMAPLLEGRGRNRGGE